MGGSFYYNCHYATSDLDLNPRALHHIAASRTLAVITSSRSLAVSVKGLARSLALSSRPRSHTHAVIIGVHRRCGDVGQHLGPRSLARAVISSSAPRSHAHAVITSSRCRRTCRGKTASTDSCGRGTFMGRPADRQRRLHMRGACEVGHGDVRTPIEPHRSRSQDGSRPVQLRPFLPNPPAHHRPWFESRGRAPLPTTPNASTPLRSTPARCKRPRVGTHWRQHVNHRTRRACSPWSYGARCAPRPGTPRRPAVRARTRAGWA